MNLTLTSIHQLIYMFQFIYEKKFINIFIITTR